MGNHQHHRRVVVVVAIVVVVFFRRGEECFTHDKGAIGTPPRVGLSCNQAYKLNLQLFPLTDKTPELLWH
ncbi:hypothetical protein DD599_27055 [Enterobacter cloacae complex sp. CH23B]|nr:hypothetical protein DD599_27055 [Enterobacter cloacae complex sp. CH23B]